MSDNNETTQAKLIMEFFEKNPNRDVSHPEIVDWATEEYRKRTGNIFRDPDRQIRQLHQKGYLIKIKKGIYRYDPAYVKQRELEDFTPTLKKAILERDNYRCVVCGRGPEDGVELHFTDDALEAMAVKAKEAGTGARALRMIVENRLIDLMYEAPSDPDIIDITIDKDCILGTKPPTILRASDQQNSG